MNTNWISRMNEKETCFNTGVGVSSFYGFCFWSDTTKMSFKSIRYQEETTARIKETSRRFTSLGETGGLNK